uniref:Mitochondrial import receptor subunit TOM40 n=1 Tax=Haptolina ericina TaxID=156174 RepID=A0A7S3ERJ9_9EUKA
MPSLPRFLKFRQDLPNPGRLEELKREAQSVLTPDVFDGARFEFNKTLTQKFALLHNVYMGSATMPSSYEFGANFGDDHVLLASRIDMGGRLSGRVNAQLSDSIMLRLQSQMGPDSGGSNNSFKADLDYKGGSNTASAYYMGGGLVGVHAMQALTQSLALGGEGFYHLQNPKVNGGAGAARLTWGTKGENVATAKVGTFGHGMAELSYQRKVSEKVGIATELQYYHNQLCTFGIGYEFRLRTATFKGLIQSDATCSAALEERVSTGVNLLLSAQLNHKKKDYKFGVGLSIGGQ